VQLFALKFGDALAVAVRIPSPTPAVKVKVQLVLAVSDVCRPVWAPDISTHLVSLLVVTVSVSACPLRAYSIPPTTAVPVPPVKAADEVVAAMAGREAMMTVAAALIPMNARMVDLRMVPPQTDGP
jgi:hypothetical protein